ncbi:MAG: hypothetical protein O3B01_25120 [Planctomycetota bacterium]|nr:hypothetical protein [Planctomycetota bacterium]MDA1141860.1 hypothetical protein [Planctomycetota bacterium]
MKPVNLALFLLCSFSYFSHLWAEERGEEIPLKVLVERLETLQLEVNKLKREGLNGQFDHLAEPLGKIVSLEFKLGKDPRDEGLRVTCATQTYRANFHQQGEQGHIAITVRGRLKLSEDTTKILLTYEIQFNRGNRQGNQAFDVAGSHLVAFDQKVMLVKLGDDHLLVTVLNAEKEL